jgi:GNAT superfamily N-acetyltransferase
MLIRPPEPHDRDDWSRLYAGYAAFYGVDQTPAMRDRVWHWIHDHEHEVECFVAESDDGRLVGLTHFRPFARPLAASIGGFLDDLFVEPDARGTGAARALIEAVADTGRQRGWTLIRWITAEDNARARALYDKLADATHWKTYDFTL